MTPALLSRLVNGSQLKVSLYPVLAAQNPAAFQDNDQRFILTGRWDHEAFQFPHREGKQMLPFKPGGLRDHIGNRLKLQAVQGAGQHKIHMLQLLPLRLQTAPLLP